MTRKMVDLPAPDSPMMPVTWPRLQSTEQSDSTIFSSYLSATRSSRMAISSAGSGGPANRPCARLSPLIADPSSEEHVREPEVERERENHGGDHRIRRGPAHSIGAAFRAKALIAGDDRHDRAEDRRLDKAVVEIARVGPTLDRVEIRVLRNAGDPVRHVVAGADADDVGEDGQQRHRKDARDEARCDQHFDGADAHRLERFDLLGDFHRPERGRDGRAGSACEDNGGEQWTEFAERAVGDAAADVFGESVLDGGLGGLKRDYGACE